MMKDIRTRTETHASGISFPVDYITSTNSARTVIVRTPHTLHFRIIVVADMSPRNVDQSYIHVGRQRADKYH
jgi:hypothetical protein